jgi:hypothetical protein
VIDKSFVKSVIIERKLSGTLGVASMKYM